MVDPLERLYERDSRQIDYDNRRAAEERFLPPDPQDDDDSPICWNCEEPDDDLTMCAGCNRLFCSCCTDWPDAEGDAACGDYFCWRCRE